MATPKPRIARERPDAIRTTPVESMTRVAAPPSARIWVGTTTGAQSGPRPGHEYRRGDREHRQQREQHRREDPDHLAAQLLQLLGIQLRESTGNATVVITSLTLR